MRRDHKVTKDVFQPPKMFPTIRMATKKIFGVKRSELYPFFTHTFISPSQPHSKMCGR
ncbi:MAG TPA: hypothetical protein VKY31_06040 [Terriglobia bacterium]|nr:hypothetical protein [Terriglobia bacterium]